MTRLIGSLVIHNEADRYLEDCIRWMQNFLDDLFVYDDRSTDKSVEIAKDLGCTVVIRPEEYPSFMKHEGKFRSHAWNALKNKMGMKEGQWILSFDADEFLVGDDVLGSLDRAIQNAQRRSKLGIILPFPEVFKYQDGKAFVRTDGFWNQIKGPRLFMYLNQGKWNMKPMGCGSEPLYVTQQKSTNQNFGLNMLHFGYARDVDKQIKYQRYSALEKHGHANSHIESILGKATLREWEGPVPQLEFK